MLNKKDILDQKKVFYFDLKRRKYFFGYLPHDDHKKHIELHFRYILT